MRSNWACPVRRLNDPETSVLLDTWRHDNRSVISTNGCFDLLHVGHLQTLSYARNLGDCLVVGVDTDDHVRLLKGRDRPVTPVTERASILAHLRFVDLVIIMEDVVEFVQAVQPRFHVKGGDYIGVAIPEKVIVEAFGGRVVLSPYVSGVSTTELLGRIKQ